MVWRYMCVVVIVITVLYFRKRFEYSDSEVGDGISDNEISQLNERQNKHKSEPYWAAPKPEGESVVVGMDIGNSYSRVGMIRNGKPWYSDKIPSCVSFDEDGDIYIGSTVNPPGISFCGFKKLIGYSPKRMKEKIDSLPYDVFPRGNKDLYVQLPSDIKDSSARKIPIKLLLTALMAKLKKLAEEELRVLVSSAVVIVPFNVSERQMQYTRRAAKIIDLDIKRFVSEPIASVMSHEYTKRQSDDARRKLTMLNAVVVVGGSHFDVALIEARDFVTLNALGMEAEFYGGEDITMKIAEKMMGEFISSNKLSNLLGFSDLKQRIYREAERIKRALRIHSNADYIIEAWDSESGALKITEGSMTRDELKNICAPMVQEIMLHIKQILADEDLKQADIYNVLLTGRGPDSIPGLRGSISNFFPYNQFLKSTDWGLHGAMLLAAQEMKSLPEKLSIIQSLPESLGIRQANGLMKILAKKGLYLPYEGTTKVEAQDIQGFPFITVQLYSGSNVIAGHNTILDKFELTGVASAYDDIEFHLKVTENNNIELRATNLRLGVSESASIGEKRSANEDTDEDSQSNRAWLLSKLEKQFEKEKQKMECEVPLKRGYSLKQFIRKGDFEKVPSYDQVKQLEMLADNMIQTVENMHPSRLECRHLLGKFDKKSSKILDAV